MGAGGSFRQDGRNWGSRQTQQISKKKKEKYEQPKQIVKKEKHTHTRAHRQIDRQTKKRREAEVMERPDRWPPSSYSIQLFF